MANCISGYLDIPLGWMIPGESDGGLEFERSVPFNLLKASFVPELDEWPIARAVVSVYTLRMDGSE